ncbi:MAG: hypothetical protein WC763_04850 [Candidatus Paceibacterota bacterium]|jgi:hypothetical protein
MQKKNQNEKGSRALTQVDRDDIRIMVSEIIAITVPPIVTGIVIKVISEVAPPIVERIVDERLDKFAIMVGRGFTDVQAQINDINERMVTKDEFNDFRAEVREFRNDHSVRITRLGGACA